MGFLSLLPMQLFGVATGAFVTTFCYSYLDFVRGNVMRGLYTIAGRAELGEAIQEPILTVSSLGRKPIDVWNCMVVSTFLLITGNKS